MYLKYTIKSALIIKALFCVSKNYINLIKNKVMTKVVLEQVNSANVKVNNSSDNERIFDIVQSMEVRSNNIMNISDGIVKQDGIVKANYQRWSESSMSV